MIDKLEKEAARWFVRMQGAAADHPERTRFEAWLAADAAHASAYADLAETLDIFRSPTRGKALADSMQERLQDRRESRRRAIKHGTAGLLAATLGLADALYLYRSHRPQWQTACRTGVGGLAHETLLDGSTLVLGANTELDVTYTRAERRVLLRQGSAIFEVSRQPDRPFVVDSDAARITVLGTRFYVHRMDGVVRVGVDHGSVQVEATRPFWRRSQLVLEAGQVVELRQPEDGRPATLVRVQQQATYGFAFERGLLCFDGAGLREVAETLSQYRRRPVRVHPPAPGVREVGIVAAVQVADIDGFIDMLPRLAKVQVTRKDDEVWLQAR